MSNDVCMGVSRIAALTLLLSVAVTDGIAAQGLSGVVTGQSGAMVGAFVVAEDVTGVADGVQAVTGADGSFSFPSLGAGEYTLRVDAMMHSGGVYQVQVPAGGTRYDVELSPLPTTIGDLPTSAQCVPGPLFDGPESVLWNELMKPMDILLWDRSVDDLTYQAAVYDRAIDGESGVVVAEGHEWWVTGAQLRLFPLKPEVYEGGFVQRQNGSATDFTYYSPGPETLRSGSFQAAHCFSIVRDASRADHVGLRFEPTTPPVGRTEVAGTFWFDRATGGLAALEFAYVGLPWRGLEDEGFGGTAEYLRRDDGRWLITTWNVETPWLQGTAERFAGIREQGGELRSTLVGEDESTLEPYVWPAGIQGIVWDSTSSEPLEGAEVRLVGTDYVALTDTDGTYSITGLPSGRRYDFTFSHPLLDRLGIEPDPVPVTPIAGQALQVDLSVPPAEVLFGRACPGGTGGSGTILAGTVRHGDSGIAMPRARITATWDQEGIGVRRSEGLSDDNGAYVICGVPGGQRVVLLAEFLVHESLRALVTTEPGRLTVWDFETGPPQPARLTGTVTDGISGEPIRDARVELVGSDLALRTDGDGDFSFPDLQPGEYEIEVSHLSYGLERTEIIVEAGAASNAQIRLTADAFELPGIEVLVDATPIIERTVMSDFFDRRERFQRQGLGNFLDEEEIRRIQPSRITDLFLAIPGVTVVTGTTSQSFVPVLRQDITGSGRCGTQGPAYYLDGAPLNNVGEDLNFFISPTDVVALEVYRRTNEIPAEFLDSRSDCGVIVIWTARGIRGTSGG